MGHIHSFGFQGDGKTYSVIDFINELRERVDMPVVTNVESYYLRNKDFCTYESNLYNIINNFKNKKYNENTIVFFDELFSLVEKGKLDKKVLTFISQFRKRGIYFLTTAQQWLDIPISFRRQSKYIVDCNMFNFFGKAFVINQIQNGKKIKWSQIDNEYVAPVIRTSIKKASKQLADSYDTYETIDDL